MSSTIKVFRSLLTILGITLTAAAVQAADYKTTLNLDPATSPTVSRVVFHWSTDIASGPVGASDLTNFALSIYGNSGLLYSDQIIANGVLQPYGGAARSAGDPVWDFDLDTLSLSQFRNVDNSTVSLSSGSHYQVSDSISLPADGIVAIFSYSNGAQVGRTDASLDTQNTLLKFSSQASSFGPDTLTVDNATGKRWLDVPIAGPYSYDSLQVELAPGGLFEDYRLATSTEVRELWQNAGINTATSEFVPENLQPILSLMDFVGLSATNGNLGEGNFFAFTSGHIASIVTEDGWVSTASISADPAGDADEAPDTNNGRASFGAVPSNNDNPDHGAWLILDLPPWVGSGSATGGTSATEVVDDGSDGSAAIFSYGNTTISGNGANGAWQFTTTASATGAVDLSYTYNGFHAFFRVTVSLEAFVTGPDGTTTVPLVSDGPVNCCTPPSGGFSYSGTVPLNVNAGDTYGFRMTGSNGDLNSQLSGTLSVSSAFTPAVAVANPVADIVIDEDSGPRAVELSAVFSPASGLNFAVTGNTNPELLADVVLSGSTLTLAPAENRNGASTITVQASDIYGATATDEFLVTVVPVNDPPFVAAPFTVGNLAVGDPAFAVDLTPVFDDVELAAEGDSLSYTFTSAAAGIVSLALEGNALQIEPVASGTSTITVTAIDSAGASVAYSTDVTVEFLGTAVLLQAVTNVETGDVVVAVRVTGETGETAQTVELFSSASCVDGNLGEDAAVFASFGIGSFDETGEAFLIAGIPNPGPISTYTSARIAGQQLSSAPSACIVAGADNDSWFRALALTFDTGFSVASTGSSTNVTGFLDSAGKSRWYKFPIQPGARTTIELYGLPKDYDLFVFKDIADAFEALQGDKDVDGLNRLSAEFAPSVFSPSVFSPSVFSPSVFSPDAYAPSVFSPSVFSPSVFSPSVFSPSVFSPSVFSPSVFSPSVFSPSVFSPSVFSPSVFSPSVFSPSVFSPEDFASAQMRSLLAVSAQTGTGSERVVADTWNNTGYFYVRVAGKNGAFDLGSPFQLKVDVDGVNCANVAPIAGSAGAQGGGYESIIVWDSARVESDPANTPTDIAELRANLNALVARPEVNGVLVDLSGLGHIQRLHEQADTNSSCPYAENLTAQAIKSVIAEYREQNPELAYVVILGSDGHVPFFRYPDQGLLGPEQDYDPPVADGTQSQSALRLNYILGQDEYGARTNLSLRDGTFPLPDLAVGRLVETAAEMNTVLEAYLATGAGVIDPPTSTLVTGYDFLTDAAEGVQFELVAGTGGVRNDTLITAADISPDDERSWTATDLRRELLDQGEDIVFLAGHFSANSTLAADYRTTALTTELASATTDFTNAIVFSAGCHSGYNIVDGDIVPGVTLPLDWTQAFAQKGATLIAGTGYQYGDTDFVEYSERLYVQFARELRRGTGPVSVGQALVRAKQQYLSTTPDIRGLHRKSVLISTVFGLPMLSVDMPGERIVDVDSTPTVTPTQVTGNPGALLGLQSADINMLFEAGADGALQDETVNMSRLDGGTLTATYLRGADGVVTNPAEPAIPLVTRNVTPAGQNLSLRGVGLRSGSWRERLIVPLTGAPTTELRGVHTPFTSPVNFPMRLATTNYFDALTGGGTTLLHVTPAQHRVDFVGEAEANLRQFDSLGFRLFYSDDTKTYGANVPALSGPPTMSGVRAVIDGTDILFLVNVVGDPAAGIHAVWVTYTEGALIEGEWQSIDLTQDPVDSTLWSARLSNAATSFMRLDYMAQAVSGTGLVTLDDNYGAYYKLAGVLGEVGSDGQPTALFDTEMSLSGPISGAYGSTVELSASLSSGAIGVDSASVLFTVGGTGRAAKTIAGNALITLPLTSTPGTYTLTASFAGNDDYAASSAEQEFTITKTGTVLTLNGGDQTVGIDGIESGISAQLKDDAGTPLLQRTVYFTLLGGPNGPITRAAITDNIGRANLGSLALPERSYQLTARFLGEIPTSHGPLLLEDDIYESSSASTTLDLIGGASCPTEVIEPPASGKGKGKGKGAPAAEFKLDIAGFCYLDHDVRGKIEIRDGTLVVGSGVSVEKKIVQTGPGSVIVRDLAWVGEKIDEDGPGDVIVLGRVEKNVREADAGNIRIGPNGHVGGNVDEEGAGTLEVSGSVDGNATESEDGDLIVTPTGEIGGHATESGNGTLSNDGWVARSTEQD